MAETDAEKDGLGRPVYRRHDGSAIKLEHCPFCGGEDLSIRKDFPEDDPGDQPPRWYAMHVFCHDCHARGRNHYRIGWCESEEAAADAWNDRRNPVITPVFPFPRPASMPTREIAK